MLDDDQDRGGVGEPEQLLGELERGRVGPVQVVDREHDRTLVGQARDQLADDLERSVLHRFGRELGQARGGFSLERQAEHGAEIRVDLEHPLAEEALDLASQRDTQPQLRFLERDAEPFAEHIAVGPVRERLAVRDATALEPERRSARRLGGFDEPTQLGAEPALADSRLAGDEEDAAGPSEHRVRGFSSRCELLVAADERRLEAQHATRPARNRTHAGRPCTR